MITARATTTFMIHKNPSCEWAQMITDRKIDQAFSDLRATYGGIREDYFGLLYLEEEHNVPREKAVNQVAFGGKDYGVDGFYFDQAPF
jgi:hypothetical protein